jgi:3-deoxy-manno-octulosonate cytidylyltransferase (CMP-KDO synthetase)
LTAAFHVIVPARLASTRLPRKPLAEIGGVPMIVRVARRAAQSSAASVVVAADHAEIVAACTAHGVEALLTGEHDSGSDRLAEACELLGLQDEQIVVNVQGDEPMLPPALVDAVAALLARSADCVMSTAANAIEETADFANPNIVKVVLDAAARALYFSRAPIPWPRDARAAGDAALGSARPLRHVGLYAYRARFLGRFPLLARSPLEEIERLEQLRVLWHGERIAVHVGDEDSGVGIDTPEDLARVRALYEARGGAGFA